MFRVAIECIAPICLTLAGAAIDGDTFLKHGALVRIWGVEATDQKLSPLWSESRDALQSLIGEEPLGCVPQPPHSFSRMVLRCENQRGEDIGCLMVGLNLAEPSQDRRYGNGYYNKCDD